MSIVVTCSCSQTYRLPDRYAGKKAKCRECGKAISVPAAAKVGSEARGKRKSSDGAPKSAEPPEKKRRKSTTRRLSSQDREIIGDRRELRRSHRTPLTSESLHQLAPMPLSGDALDVPARTPKPAVKRGKASREGSSTKKGKHSATKASNGKEPKKGKTEVETKHKAKDGKKVDAARRSDDKSDKKSTSKGKKSKIEPRGKRKLGAARRSSREDDSGEDGDEGETPSAPRVNLNLIVIIAGVLCLGVGLVVGLVMRGGLSTADIDARWAKIRDLETDRQWTSAKAELDKLLLELKGNPDDGAITRTQAMSRGAGMMIQIAAIKDRDSKLGTLIKYSIEHEDTVRLGVVRELADFMTEADAHDCVKKMLADPNKQVADTAKSILDSAPAVIVPPPAAPAAKPAAKPAPPAAPAEPKPADGEPAH
jgi:hypothetical protein